MGEGGAGPAGHHPMALPAPKGGALLLPALDSVLLLLLWVKKESHLELIQSLSNLILQDSLCQRLGWAGREFV